jgi:hypothetical protein
MTSCSDLIELVKAKKICTTAHFSASERENTFQPINQLMFCF